MKSNPLDVKMLRLGGFVAQINPIEKKREVFKIIINKNKSSS